MFGLVFRAVRRRFGGTRRGLRRPEFAKFGGPPRGAGDSRLSGCNSAEILATYGIWRSRRELEAPGLGVDGVALALQNFSRELVVVGRVTAH